VPKFLLDSDVIIWCLRSEEKWLSVVEDLRTKGPICCSAISLFEVEAGKRPGEEMLTEEFLGGLDIYDVTPEVAVMAGKYSREFRSRGITLNVPDLVIAATAALHRLELVTANPKHYPMEGVEVYGR
jgi:predicted nucleic acid-binding protein